MTGKKKITAQDVKHILNQYALLHNGGHGRSDEMRKISDSARFWEKMTEQRVMLLSAESVSRIQSAYDWIVGNLKRGHTKNRRHTSYGLKHIMQADGGVYVSNGEFIVAMCLAGFDMDYREYNPVFNTVRANVDRIVKRTQEKRKVAV